MVQQQMQNQGLFFYGLALSEEILFSAKFVKIPFELLMIDKPWGNSILDLC